MGDAGKLYFPFITQGKIPKKHSRNRRDLARDRAKKDIHVDPRYDQLFDMHGKVAIVTGGGTHLGIAFTESLAELGAHVYIASRRAQLCKDIALQLRGRGLQVTGLPSTHRTGISLNFAEHSR